MKKLNVINKTIFLNLRFFVANHPPTRHLKYEGLNFTLRSKPIMATKLSLINLKRFLERIKSPLTRF